MGLKDKLNSDFDINWNEEYIYSMDCGSCGKEMLIKKFKSEIYDKERWCSDCQDKYKEDEDVKAK
jgi:Ni,Fe-hydrogenase III small subunit